MRESAKDFLWLYGVFTGLAVNEFGKNLFKEAHFLSPQLPIPSAEQVLLLATFLLSMICFHIINLSYYRKHHQNLSIARPRFVLDVVFHTMLYLIFFWIAELVLARATLPAADLAARNALNFQVVYAFSGLFSLEALWAASFWLWPDAQTTRPIMRRWLAVNALTAAVPIILLKFPLVLAAVGLLRFDSATAGWVSVDLALLFILAMCYFDLRAYRQLFNEEGEEDEAPATKASEKPEALAPMDHAGVSA